MKTTLKAAIALLTAALLLILSFSTVFAGVPDVPDTGDNSKIGLIVGLLGGSALVIVLLLVISGRSKKKK